MEPFQANKGNVMLKSTRRLTARVAFAGLAGIASLAAGATTALADTPVKFTLDWKFEGPAAGFLLALDKGYFKAEGLDVTIDSGNGSVEAISRVATGTYDMGFGDINSLIKLLDEDPSQKITGVFMVYDRPTFAVVGRKSLGITDDPRSLEGKTLGAPPPDGAFAQWKAFKAVAGIDDSKITLESIGFPVREPMLAKGDVDAVFGFSFSVILNLKAQGVPADDIAPILMAEHGLNLYGNTVTVNTDFAANNPDAVKGVLKALAKGFADAVANPGEGVEAVLKRNETLNSDIELERLTMANAQNIKTPYVAEHGMGGVDPARLAASIATLKTSMGLKGAVTADKVFDPSFLPPEAERHLP